MGQKEVYDVLKDGKAYTVNEIAEINKLSKNSIRRALKHMLEQDEIKIVGMMKNKHRALPIYVIKK